MSSKLARGLFVVAGVCCVLVIIIFLSTSTRPEPLPVGLNNTEAAAEAVKSHQDRNAENDTTRSSDSKITLGGRTAMPAKGAAKSVSSSESVAKWTQMMNEKEIPLISFYSLHLTEEAVALMELPPEQAQEVNRAIEKFLRKLRAEEIANAYVSIDASGKEQIVVPPFDRKKIIEAFRNELRTVAGAGVEQFLGKQATFNRQLIAGNWEMRAYVEQQPSGEYKEVFVYTTQAPSRTIDGVKLAPSEKNTVTSSVGILVRPRHLFAAKNELPRVAETHP